MSRHSTVTHEAPVDIAEAARALGEHLREARVARGLTLSEVGEMLGISRFTVAHAERGKLGTSIGVYLSIMAAMEVELVLLDVLRPERRRLTLAPASATMWRPKRKVPDPEDQRDTSARANVEHGRTSNK